MSENLSYRDTGVDLDAAARAKDKLKELVESTRDQHTLSCVGHFGGLYELPEQLKSPVLVSSADGVGTKLKVAFQSGDHGTVGQCLVNHCVNDILVQGATPLFFLDYLATGALRESIVEEVVRGVATACKENTCALLGGETAEMPGFYPSGEYDLAGFIVGVVQREQLIDGSAICEGDVLLGIESSGLHTNGYTLARHIVFDVMKLSVVDELPGLGRNVGDELLAVHRSYLPPLKNLLERGLIRGLAHITGGGIPGNLPRVLPEGLGASVSRSSWDVPPLFQMLQEAGKVDRDEMDRVFNMGIGMIAVVAPEVVETVSCEVEKHGIGSWVIGEVEAGEGVAYV